MKTFLFIKIGLKLSVIFNDLFIHIGPSVKSGFLDGKSSRGLCELKISIRIMFLTYLFIISYVNRVFS